jgi:hypothetical protein
MVNLSLGVVSISSVAVTLSLLVNLVGQNLELDDRKILIYSKKLLKICK